eukprot:c12500_g2_i1.p1 GENE.c12500_g2_i1~~c12500_g2_i1.p1  ORF type:complete len:430 (+),score=109.66 c12500_g2_i1:96-1385(+)
MEMTHPSAVTSTADVRSRGAMDEYADKGHLSVFCSMEELEQNFHKGVVLYFKFCRFIIITNFVLFLCSLISVIPFIANNHNVAFADSVYVSVYSEEERSPWKVSSILAIILSFSFIPGWLWYGSKLDIGETKFDDSTEDAIPGMENVPASSRFFRRVFSTLCFVVVLLISLGIAFAFAEAQWAAQHAQRETDNSTLGFSFVVSAAISITNMVMQRVARALTNFEKRSTWTSVRNSNALKLTLLKVLNVWMFMIAKFEVQQRRRKESTVAETCYLGLVGRQYFALIVLELTVSNFIEVAVPLIYRRLLRKYGEVSDYQSKAEFDVSVEYLELVYRQYVVYVAFNSFPLVAGLAVITNVVEFYLDRYRLIYLLKTTGNMQMRRMVQVLGFFLTLVAVAALLSFPSGSAFTLGANQQQFHNFWRNCNVMPLE